MLNALVKKKLLNQMWYVEKVLQFPFDSLSILQLFAVAAPALVFLCF